ncbi:MAG: tyrosine-type recombinase/integrase [Acidimicrobiales bacterium]
MKRFRRIDAITVEQTWIAEYLSRVPVLGFAGASDGNGLDVVERLLEATGRLAWDVTGRDLGAGIQALEAAGLAAPARRNHLQVFTGFHRYLAAHKAADIHEFFGVTLSDPLGEMRRWPPAPNPGLEAALPRPERVDAFFDFVKGRLAAARKAGPLGRDYVLFRTLYHAGLRTEEACGLHVGDVDLRRGPTGAIRVRRSGSPRPDEMSRWVPTADGLDLILRWYVEDARPTSESGVLFCDEHGRRLRRGRARGRLASLLEVEGRPESERFSPHVLRRAGVVRAYERGVHVRTLQRMLGCHDLSEALAFVVSHAFASSTERPSRAS